MAVQHLTTGGEPHLKVGRCSGDLDVRGSAHHEINLTDEGQLIKMTSGEDGVMVESLEGSSAIQIPEGARLTLGEVDGCVRIKGVRGMVTMELVSGDCLSSRTGPLTISVINGQAHLRRASGEINISRIDGDVALRDIQGAVQITDIHGDCSLRNCPAGALLEQVAGDLVMRTDLNPESTYRLAAGGDVEIRIPIGTGVRVSMPQHQDLQPGEGMMTSQEGDQTVVIMDDGGSSAIMVSAGGTVSISQDNTFGPEENFGTTFDRDIEAMMDDVSAKLDSNLRHLETKLDRLPDRVRHKVERKLTEARRHVEAASRHARQAAERVYADPAEDRPGGRPGASPDEPLSDKERLAVLRMVEEGKITVNEAQMLLAALEGKR